MAEDERAAAEGGARRALQALRAVGGAAEDGAQEGDVVQVAPKEAD